MDGVKVDVQSTITMFGYNTGEAGAGCEGGEAEAGACRAWGDVEVARLCWMGTVCVLSNCGYV